MKILAIIGKSQYDSTKIFLQEMIEEISSYPEISVDYLDSYDMDSFSLQRTRLKHIKYDVILTINGMILEPDSCLGEILLQKDTIYCTMLMDHPFVHHQRLSNPYPHMMILSPDEHHVSYLEQYYPNIWREEFLAHGGCQAKNTIPYEERTISLSFMGSYTPPQRIWNSFDQYPEKMKHLFQNVCHILMENPSFTLEMALRIQMRNLGLSIPDSDFPAICAEFRPVDTFIRNYFRNKVVRTIIESGIPVDVYGDGWELMEGNHYKNLRIHPKVDFKESLEITANSKITLNVMPWFKEGTHDRVFTAMLCGSLCLTDTSFYLEKECKNNENIIFYHLEKLDRLPGQIDELLHNDKDASQIAANGRKLAEPTHTWSHRGKELLDYLKTAQQMQK